MEGADQTYLPTQTLLRSECTHSSDQFHDHHDITTPPTIDHMNGLFQVGTSSLLQGDISIQPPVLESPTPTTSSYKCCGSMLNDLHELLQHLEQCQEENDADGIELYSSPSPPVGLDVGHSALLPSLLMPVPLPLSTSSSTDTTISPYESPNYPPVLHPGLIFQFDAFSPIQLATSISPFINTNPVSVSLADICSVPPPSKSSYVSSDATSSSMMIGRSHPPTPSATSSSHSHPYTSKRTNRATASRFAPEKKARKYVHKRFVNMRNAHLQQEKEHERAIPASIPSPPPSTSFSSGSSSDDDDDNMSDLESVKECMELDDENINATMVLTRYGRLRHIMDSNEIMNDDDIIGLVIELTPENDEDDIPLSDLALLKAMPNCLTRQTLKVQMKESNCIKVISSYTIYRCTAPGCNKKYKHATGLKLHLKNFHPIYYAQKYLPSPHATKSISNMISPSADHDISDISSRIFLKSKPCQVLTHRHVHIVDIASMIISY